MSDSDRTPPTAPRAAPGPGVGGAAAAERGASGGDSAISALFRLLAPYRARVAALSALIAVAAGVSQIAPQFVRYVIDTVVPSGELRLFLLTGLAFLGYHLVVAALDYASMYLSFAFTQRVVHDVRQRVYGHLLALPLRRFTAERSGSLVSRVVSDVNALESMIQAGASRIVGQLFSIVVVFAILVAMNVWLALISVVFIVLMGVATLVFQGPLRRLARRIRARVGEMTAVASEAIGNVGVVKAFTAEGLEFRRFRDESATYLDLNMERRRTVGLLNEAIYLSSELGVAAVVLTGGWLIATGGGEGPGGLTIGELTAFLLYLGNLFGPVRFVLNFNNVLQAGVAAMERIDALIAEQPEVGGSAPLGPGALVFDRVGFAYPESEQEALRELTLRVDPGETVALVGPSGAGKSTVTRLLLRLYDPQRGRVTWGGQGLDALPIEVLRRAVAIVPQEPTLFSGSVRENIRYGRPDASDDEVVEAAELANAAGFIEALPRGYATEIGERGVKLSGGQKQRVAIARAILRGARLLVLDEATSSLDSESERVIQDALEGIFARERDLTSLVIAHRLSTVRNADRIVVLDDGRVAEEGDHTELLARGGIYARLWRLQAGEEVSR